MVLTSTVRGKQLVPYRSCLYKREIQAIITNPMIRPWTGRALRRAASSTQDSSWVLYRCGTYWPYVVTVCSRRTTGLISPSYRYAVYIHGIKITIWGDVWADDLNRNGEFYVIPDRSNNEWKSWSWAKQRYRLSFAQLIDYQCPSCRFINAPMKRDANGFKYTRSKIS